MNTLLKYMSDKKMDSEAMAAELSEKMGRTISKNGVEMMAKRKEAPIPWLNALGISPKEPGAESEKNKKVDGDVNPTENLSPLPFEIVSARATIEMIYTMVGRGAAMGVRTPAIADAWKDNAPSLAEAWINWARENRTVANGIAMLTVGGPGGQVILLNASLLITTLMLYQQERGKQIIPPQFIPPHEDPRMDDEKIRENTEAAVDFGIGIPPQG